MGMRFILHPTVLQMSSPPPIVKWIVNSISSGLDTLFLTRFESQRADYWQTLYSSVSMGAPYLIFCSEDDDLAPWHVIFNFAQRLEALGGDVKMVKWNRSSHVGHYRNYPIEYSAAVTELLGKSSTIYSQRIRQLEGEERMGFDSSHDEEHGPFQSLKKATKNANQIVRRVALGSKDHFVVPTSVEYHDGKAVGSVEDGERGGFIQLTNLPRINAHGVLGQILYDVCVPKNVEDWDVKDSSNFSMAPFPNLSRRIYMNPIKCIRKSRL
ncbi:uncharacterized protein LOC124920027 [Impatiens glandulifera]|uniref:uncharacterized protein LOC124920027 n=1 Tax=Impatiens glandulifera TaxID=253017 RepID=UPI001FB08D14|nr:uncharacterized protein LOC124920027 [Impatiens glandulifera]